MMSLPKYLEKGQSVWEMTELKQKNVLLVENLKSNLLSVSQTCDQGHILIFDSKKCEIRKEDSGKLVATATRTPSDVYILNTKKKKNVA
jgi:hypothetical protein